MRSIQLGTWGLVLMLLLAIWNICQAQDSLGMRCVSTLDYWQDVGGIQMVGDLAYIVSGNTLHILTLADPATPVEIGQASWSDSWSGNSVYVTGNLAYVSPGYGVIVYDISNPAHPVALVDWQPGNQVEDFMPLGDIAIMKYLEGALCIVDISDLGNMHIVSSNFPPNLDFRAVGMTGEYLCLRYMGLSLWDISNPILPVQVAQVDTQFWFFGEAMISGNYVYAGTWTNGLRIIDVSDPLHPFEAGSCDTGVCEGVTVAGNHAVVSNGNGLNIWNVINPTQPIYESTFEPQIWFNRFLSSSENLVCGGDRGIHTPSLVFIDITDPYLPAEVSTFGSKGFVRRMAVNDNIGYLAGNWSALHSIDLTNPTEAVELGRSNEIMAISAMDVAIKGTYAYTACGTRGLRVFDISNPAQPDCVMSIDLATDDILRLIVIDDYAYVIDSYNNVLRIFSLENPAEPLCVNSISWHGSSYCGFEAANGYLYYGHLAQFHVYSLADPDAPELVGSYNWTSGFLSDVRDIALLDNFAYVAYRYGGVRILDVSDPTHPNEVNSIPEPTWAVAASSNTLMTFGLDGITARDVTDRTNPITVGYYHYDALTEWIRDMDILGQYLLTVAGGKFRVYECDALLPTPPYSEMIPHEFALLPPYPNPFNTSVVISYSLPTYQRVRINIFNILGEQVATIADRMASPGVNSIIWDARDMASGIYFCRLESGSFNQTKKLLLLK